MGAPVAISNASPEFIFKRFMIRKRFGESGRAPKVLRAATANPSTAAAPRWLQP
jgi:hypothetical protein